MDLGLGPDVDAARGFVHDEHPGRGGEPAGEKHFLLVPAGELAYLLSGVAEADPEFSAAEGALDESVAGAAVEPGADHVVGDALVDEKALGLPVLRHVGDAGFDR